MQYNTYCTLKVAEIRAACLMQRALMQHPIQVMLCTKELHRLTGHEKCFFLYLQIITIFFFFSPFQHRALQIFCLQAKAIYLHSWRIFRVLESCVHVNAKQNGLSAAEQTRAQFQERTRAITCLLLAACSAFPGSSSALWTCSMASLQIHRASRNLPRSRETGCPQPCCTR